MPEAEAALSRQEGWGARVRRRWRSRRVIVRDVSMIPALEPGDRLLVDPWERGGPVPGVGDIVVFEDPEQRGRLLVKRVGTSPTSPNGTDRFLGPPPLYVVGDAPDGSRDSRTFGPVPMRDVVGVVWFRYLPWSRRGRIPTGAFFVSGKV